MEPLPKSSTTGSCPSSDGPGQRMTVPLTSPCPHATRTTYAPPPGPPPGWPMSTPIRSSSTEECGRGEIWPSGQHQQQLSSPRSGDCWPPPIVPITSFPNAEGADAGSDVHNTLDTSSDGGIIEAMCLLPRVGDEGIQCGVTMRYKTSDRSAIIKHLCENHSTITTKRPGGPHVLCPDDNCLCRFRGKDCVVIDQAGQAIPHRTHVVDYVRHYIDCHLTEARLTCSLCGHSFTRRGSLARHQKKGTRACPP